MPDELPTHIIGPAPSGLPATRAELDAFLAAAEANLAALAAAATAAPSPTGEPDWLRILLAVLKVIAAALGNLPALEPLLVSLEAALPPRPQQL